MAQSRSQILGAFIEGEEWMPPDAQLFESVNPATAETVAEVLMSSATDVDRAVNSAAAAQREWRGLAPIRRAELIWAWADSMVGETEQLALADVRDMGKVVNDARADVPKAARFARYWAGMADKLWGDQIPATPGFLSYTLREPLGVIGILLPWNGPTIMFVARVAVAIACGNAVVVKPSELSPTSALLLAELAVKAGLPPGLINVIPGAATTGESLVTHPLVTGVNFTGSVATGRRVAIAAAPYFKQVVLELGGKAPNIVFEDADLDEAVRAATWGVFQNAGQTCCAATRLLVQRSVARRVIDELAGLAGRVRVGDPMDQSSHIGPLVSDAQRDRVLEYIDSARSEGGRIIAGGRVPAGPLYEAGFYLSPTVLGDMQPEARASQEEIFGPVLSVLEFETEDDAVELANGTEYGLTANVWTTDIRKMLRMADALDCGVVWGNSAMLMDPALAFGGTKHSGLGRAAGREAIEGMTRTKRVSIRYQAGAPLPAWSDLVT
jgi:acyl-CoA reductase-like NAD-dependent aldehyde dehydrogenase